MKKLILLFFVVSVCLIQNAFSQQNFKLHSHNDYLRNVPFWEAFGAGSASIEVDVVLQDGELMAAHEQASIRKEHTLTSLYLEPIQKALELGMIEEFEFSLLIDCKTEAYSTLDQIIEDASGFEKMLYSSKNPTGLKLIISGNRPKPEDYKNYPQWILFDYQSKVLTSDLPWEKIGMVSLSFRQFSVWNGKGRIVEAEKAKLDEFISLVHSFEKPVRFWATPDSKSAWKAFFDMGIDYINTDNPAQAQIYLNTIEKNVYENPAKHEVYSPAFDQDGKEVPVKNIILMIGDGNGLAQISSGLFANQGQLNLTQLKNIGLIKTQAANDFTTDSAAGATAFATGNKANNRALGLNPEGDSIANIPEILDIYGFSSGIITTDQLTGATPSAFYAHHSERDDSSEIAAWLPKSKLDLFIGGGGATFSGKLDEFEKSGFTLIERLDRISNSSAKRIGYFASESSLPSFQDGRGNYLSKNAIQATQFFLNKKSPFFLMIESGMIDSGGHSNKTSMIVTEMLDFDQAIGEMIRFADQNPGTLLIITADHETGGVSIPQGNVNSGEIELAFHSNDHTGIMVPIFAYGTHSGDFRGVYENTEVFEKLLRLIKLYY